MGEQSPGGCWLEVDLNDRSPSGSSVRMDITPADDEVFNRQWDEISAAVRQVCDLDGRSPGPLQPTRTIHAPGSLGAAEAAIAAGAVSFPLPYRCTPGSTDHESGILPLGGEWVDVNGRARVTQGIYVAGPATIPRMGSANPSLTTIALSKRLADKIREDLV